MNLFNREKQKHKRSLMSRAIQFLAMGAGNWGGKRRQAHLADKQQKAARKNDWPTWIRLQVAAGRHLKKAGKRDTSGYGARRYDELERVAKLRRRGLI